MGNKYQRQNGESMKDFQARCQASEAKPAPVVKSKRRGRRPGRLEQSMLADHIDGYDRDDLGESPDY